MAQGWTRRFVGAPPRLQEAVQLYQSLGYQVLLEPQLPEELDDECKGCALALGLYRVIFTRPGPADRKPHARWRAPAQPRAGAPTQGTPMKITDTLKDEHRILRARLDRLEQLLDAGAPLAGLRTAAALLSGALLSHAHLEDDLLFPALESHMGAGNGPLTVMRAEHEEIERGLAALSARQSAAEVRETLAQVLQVARQHFAKEDEVLFPMAEHVLDGGALEYLSAELLRRRGGHPLEPA